MHPPGCPDLEDLAAFLDGTLPAPQRDAIVAHLATCDDCLELFASGASFQEEERAAAAGETAPSQEVIDVDTATPSPEAPATVPRRPFERRKERERHRSPLSGAPRFRRAARAAAALAALLLAVLGFVLFRAMYSSGLSTERLAAAVDGSSKVVEQVPFSRSKRGGPGDEAEIPPERWAFKLGVRLLDIRLALDRGTSNRAAAEALRRIIPTLNSAAVPYPEIVERYTGLLKKLDQGAAPRSLLPAAAAIEKDKELADDLEQDRDYVDLGRWTEACRLNGLEGKLPPEPSRAASLLDRVLGPHSSDTGSLGSRAVEILHEIRQGLAVTTAAPGDAQRAANLGQSCQRLLENLDSE
jgi:hypothetical protein